LLISGSLPPMKCGVGDYTSLFAKELGTSRDVRVLVLTDVAAERGDYGSAVEVLPIIQGWRSAEIVKILRAVRNWQADIVHIQYPTRGYGRSWTPYWLPPILGLFKVPVVQTWHEPYTGKTRLRYLPNSVTRDMVVVVEPDYESRLPGWQRWLTRRKRFKYIPVASNIPRAELGERERAIVRAKYGAASGDLIVYFGFASPAKGIGVLFDIADPERDRLILICDLDSADPYHERLRERIEREPWAGRASITGFLPVEEVGRVLAAADAAAFPFLDGVSPRNTSFLAAKAQGTFVLTTSHYRRGYDPVENTYYARPGDVAEMREAMRTYIGRRSGAATTQPAGWSSIAAEHLRLYREVLKETSSAALAAEVRKTGGD
jgi:hypothetical protein